MKSREDEGRSRSDFHKVALRPRHSPYPLLSVDEAMQVVMANAPCLGSTSVDGLQCKQRFSAVYVCDMRPVFVLAVMWCAVSLKVSDECVYIPTHS